MMDYLAIANNIIINFSFTDTTGGMQLASYIAYRIGIDLIGPLSLTKSAS